MRHMEAWPHAQTIAGLSPYGPAKAALVFHDSSFIVGHHPFNDFRPVLGVAIYNFADPRTLLIDRDQRVIRVTGDSE